MKAKFLVVLCLVTTIIYSQNNYSVSGGALGAANFSKFSINNDNSTIHENIDYGFRAGWALGAWVNFPVSNGFSIEPQIMYNAYRYVTNSTAINVLIRDGKIGYVSIPLLLKFHLGDQFALTLGPQVDFMTAVKNNSGSTAQEDNFKQASFSGSAGLEIFPHGNLTIFGRWVHGFSNMNNINDATMPKYRNQDIQLGLKLRLFGKRLAPKYQATTVVPPPVQEEVKKEEVIVKTEPPKPDLCAIDSDNDGVMDCNDKCVNVAGVAKYDGCPIPDRDHDGVNDEEDKCPDVPGTVANNGCPEVKEVSDKLTHTVSTEASYIQFTGQTTKFTVRSNASLNHIVTILNENPDLKVKIEGHTSNVGDDDANMKLSTNRAEAVKTYLVSKGISADRITTEGFGETMPIADNNTSAGRIKNARVEIKLSY